MAQVEQIHKEVQLDFEGMPVKLLAYSLSSVSDEHTTKPLTIDQQVSGTFFGVVRQVIHYKTKDGDGKRVAKVEVLESTLEE